MIVSIDVGTTSISGILSNASGHVSASVSRNHQADVGGLASGRYEQRLDKLTTVFESVIAELAAHSARPVTDVILTGQMHGVVLVDNRMRPLSNLITWRDRRAEGLPDEWLRHPFPDETGCSLHPGYGGATVAFMKMRGELPAGVFKALSIVSYFQTWLGGKTVTDETFATSFGVWNLRKNAWHEKLLVLLGIPRELLPDFLPAGACCGTVRAGHVLAGAAIHNGIGDNQAGILGVQDGNACQAVVNIGTSSQISLPLPSFAFNPKLETRPFPGGRFFQVYGALCGGWALAYLAEFFRDVVKNFAHRDVPLEGILNAMNLVAAGSDSHGLVADTCFAGVRGKAGVSGSIARIASDNLTAGNLIAAFAMGIADELASAVPVPEGMPILVVGNAARRNAVLMEALNRRFGRQCVLANVKEASAVGASKLVSGCE